MDKARLAAFLRGCELAVGSALYSKILGRIELLHSKGQFDAFSCYQSEAQKRTAEKEFLALCRSRGTGSLADIWTQTELACLHTCLARFKGFFENEAKTLSSSTATSHAPTSSSSSSISSTSPTSLSLSSFSTSPPSSGSRFASCSSTPCSCCSSSSLSSPPSFSSSPSFSSCSSSSPRVAPSPTPSTISPPSSPPLSSSPLHSSSPSSSRSPSPLSSRPSRSSRSSHPSRRSTGSSAPPQNDPSTRSSQRLREGAAKPAPTIPRATDEWDVRGIVGWRSTPNLTSSDGREYEIDWEPYPQEGDTTWEPLQVLTSCNDILHAFWAKKGIYRATGATLEQDMIVLAPWEQTYYHAQVIHLRGGGECTVYFLWNDQDSYDCRRFDPTQPEPLREINLPIAQLFIDPHPRLQDRHTAAGAAAASREPPSPLLWACHFCSHTNSLKQEECGSCGRGRRASRAIPGLREAATRACALVPSQFTLLAVVSEPSLYRDAVLPRLAHIEEPRPWSSDRCIFSQLHAWFPSMELVDIQNILRWCGISGKCLLAPFHVLSSGQQHRTHLAYVLLKYISDPPKRPTCVLEFGANIDLHTARSIAAALARLRQHRGLHTSSLVVSLVEPSLVPYLGCDGALQLRMEQVNTDSGLGYEFTEHYLKNPNATSGEEKWFLPQLRVTLRYQEVDDEEVDLEIPEFGFGMLPPHLGPQVQVKLDKATRFMEAHYPLFEKGDDWDGWLHQRLPTLKQFRFPPKWRLGALLGPSGCGKSLLLAQISQQPLQSLPLWPPNSFPSPVDCPGAPDDRPLREYFGEDAGDYLGAMQVPQDKWDTPWSHLSGPEAICACYARALAEKNPCTLDEFTSELPRKLAKSVARGLRQLLDLKPELKVIIASCHLDLQLSLDADWTLNPATSGFELRAHIGSAFEERQQTQTGWAGPDVLFGRPTITLDLRPCDTSVYRLFEQHHYLSSPLHSCTVGFLGRVGSQKAVFVGVIHQYGKKGWFRTSRLVVLPGFQGLGLGPRSEDAVATLFTTVYGGAGYCVKTFHDYARTRTDSGMWIGGKVKTAGITNYSHKWATCNCETRYHTDGCRARQALQKSRFDLFPEPPGEKLPILRVNTSKKTRKSKKTFRNLEKSKQERKRRRGYVAAIKTIEGIEKQQRADSEGEEEQEGDLEAELAADLAEEERQEQYVRERIQLALAEEEVEEEEGHRGARSSSIPPPLVSDSDTIDEDFPQSRRAINKAAKIEASKAAAKLEADKAAARLEANKVRAALRRQRWRAKKKREKQRQQQQQQELEEPEPIEVD